MAGKGVEAGKAYISLSMATRGLKRSMQVSLKLIKSFAKMAATAFVALGATIGAAMTGALTKFVSLGDEMHKTAMRTGLSAESLSQLAFAAEQSGTTLDALSAALFRSQRRIANAVTETGPAARALAELGLSANELSQMTPEDQFFRLVEALDAMENQGRKSQLAFEVFGDNWRDLAPLINQGSDAIRSYMVEADALGATFTTEQAQNAANLSDAWNEIKTAARGLGMELANQLAPAVTAAIRWLTKLFILWEKGWAESKLAFQEVATGLVVSFPKTIDILRKAFALWLNDITRGIDAIANFFGIDSKLNKAVEGFTKRMLTQTTDQLVAGSMAKLEAAQREAREAGQSAERRLALLDEVREQRAELAKRRAQQPQFEEVTGALESAKEVQQRINRSTLGLAGFAGAFTGKGRIDATVKLQEEANDHLAEIEKNTDMAMLHT